LQSSAFFGKCAFSSDGMPNLGAKSSLSRMLTIVKSLIARFCHGAASS